MTLTTLETSPAATGEQLTPAEFDRRWSDITERLELGDIEPDQLDGKWPDICEGLGELEDIMAPSLPPDLQSSAIKELKVKKEELYQELLDVLMENPAESIASEMHYLLTEVYRGRLVERGDAALGKVTYFGTRSPKVPGGIDGLYGIAESKGTVSFHFSMLAKTYAAPKNYTLVVDGEAYRLMTDVQHYASDGTTSTEVREVTSEYERTRALEQFFTSSLRAAAEVRRRSIVRNGVQDNDTADQDAKRLVSRLVDNPETAPLRQLA